MVELPFAKAKGTRRPANSTYLRSTHSPKEQILAPQATNDEPLSSKLAVVEEAVAIIVDRFTDCQSL